MTKALNKVRHLKKLQLELLDLFIRKPHTYADREKTEKYIISRFMMYDQAGGMPDYCKFSDYEKVYNQTYNLCKPIFAREIKNIIRRWTWQNIMMFPEKWCDGWASEYGVYLYVNRSDRRKKRDDDLGINMSHYVSLTRSEYGRYVRLQDINAKMQEVDNG